MQQHFSKVVHSGVQSKVGRGASVGSGRPTTVRDQERALQRVVEATGSAALGTWQPHTGDIDTLIVTARPPTTHDLAVLDRIHRSHPHRPHLDGIYLDPTTFASHPADQRATACRGEHSAGTDRTGR